MRGIWLATVSRLDWPPVASVNGRSADQRIAGFVFLGTPTRPLEERPRGDLSRIVYRWNP